MFISNYLVVDVSSVYLVYRLKFSQNLAVVTLLCEDLLLGISVASNLLQISSEPTCKTGY